TRCSRQSDERGGTWWDGLGRSSSPTPGTVRELRRAAAVELLAISRPEVGERDLRKRCQRRVPPVPHLVSATRHVIRVGVERRAGRSAGRRVLLDAVVVERCRVAGQGYGVAAHRVVDRRSGGLVAVVRGL